MSTSNQVEVNQGASALSSSSASSPFSPALFEALLDALQPTNVSIKIITTIALGNMGYARPIVDMIERRFYSVAIESLHLRMLWVVVDLLMKGAPLIYAPLFAVHIPSFAEKRIPWQSHDALTISYWIQCIIASWQGLLPMDVWRAVHDGVRQRRTRMLLERRDALADEDEDGGEGGVGRAGEANNSIESIDDEEAALRRLRQRRGGAGVATHKQLDALKAQWERMCAMVGAACGEEGGSANASSVSDGPQAKRHRTEQEQHRSEQTSATQQHAAALPSPDTNAEKDDADDDADFDLGDFDPNALVLDKNGNPIMALQEVQLPVTARAPRRRR